MKWLKQLLSGQPHFTIGSNEDPYMLRWYVIPRNRRLNVYLHKFIRDDDDRALHDHPWWFVSLVLAGGYRELVPGGVIVRKAISLAFRRAEHRHRVVLFGDPLSTKKPCWTLVITGRSKRTWGFYCPKGFVPWYQFVSIIDKGQIGRGCE